VLGDNGGGTPTPTPTEAAGQRKPPPPEKTKPQPRGPSNADKARARDLVAQGNNQTEQGEYNAAIASFQQAMDLDPNSEGARSGMAKAQKAKATEDEIMKRR
jgi:Tfp pilus assembly protein PilF